MVLTFKKGTLKQFQGRLRLLPIIETQTNYVSLLILFSSKLVASFKKVSPLFVPLCGSGVTKLLALDFNCLSKGIVRARRLITLSGAFYLKVIGSNPDYAARN